jgi:hypothetical protein
VVNSLNVAASAALLVYEALRQRGRLSGSDGRSAGEDGVDDEGRACAVRRAAAQEQTPMPPPL